MKYLFYAIIYDVAGNTTAIGGPANPSKTIITNIQNVTGISINPSLAQTKNIGDTFKITATVSPSDANNKSITWSSSNSGVATVDGNGNVRCVSAGTTTITATASDGSSVKASLELTVRDPLTNLTLDKTQTTLLYGGATTTVTASTTPSDYDANNLTWTIGDTSLATISGSGKTRTITSNNTKKTGETTLTVSGGGKTATMKINIVNFTTTTYSYTGSVQQVDLPAGTYKLECWGAQGASGQGRSQYINGGFGGYSVGTYTITTNITIYVVVGQQGITCTTSSSGLGGYNGGGSSTTKAGNTSYCIAWGGGGGGATHIATRNGILSSLESYKSDILLVAGGGGAGDDDSYYLGSGSGGGYQGKENYYYHSDTKYKGLGGSQTSGGESYGVAAGFGFGGKSSEQLGGGGGWYGGGAGGSNSSGGGGSGYINTSKLTNAFMYGYNVATSSATTTKTYSTTNISSTPTSNYAKSGDGAARITPIN